MSGHVLRLLCLTYVEKCFALNGFTEPTAKPLEVRDIFGVQSQFVPHMVEENKQMRKRQENVQLRRRGPKIHQISCHAAKHLLNEFHTCGSEFRSAQMTSVTFYHFEMIDFYRLLSKGI